MSRLRLALVVACLLQIGTYLVLMLWHRDFVVYHLPLDDGFYYFEIARNFVAGNGLSFDGIHDTNGFHPLWQATCTLVAYVVRDLELYVVCMLTIGVLLHLVAVVVFVRFLADLTGKAAWSALLIAFNPNLLLMALSGMEWSLSLCCYAAMLRQLQRAFQEPAQAPAFLWRGGLLGGLAVVARLDLVLAVLLTIGMVVRELFSRLSLRVIALALVLATLPCAIFLGANRLQTGHFGTVSNAVKVSVSAQQAADASLPERTRSIATASADMIDSSLYYLLPLPRQWIAFAYNRHGLRLGAVLRPPIVLAFFLLAAVGGVSLLRRVRETGPVASWYFAPAAVHTVLHVGAIVLLITSFAQYSMWYFVVEILLLYAVVHVGWEWLAVRDRRWPFVLGSVVGLGMLLSWTGILFGPEQVTSEWRNHKLRSVREVQQRVPAGERIAAWNAGTFAYWSQYPTTNLDGLVNTHEYLEGTLLRGTAAIRDYLAREQIRYVVDVTPVDELEAGNPFGLGLTDYEVLWQTAAIPQGVTVLLRIRDY